jgi:hypothetical protein
MNHSNKIEQSMAESEEGRPLIKENTHQVNTRPTQSGERVSQGLAGVRKAAREHQEMKFTALLHHVTVDLLRDSFGSLKRKAAPGVDGVTWQEYAVGLEDRITDLHSRLHRGAYRALPSRRVYIEKADGRKRPLGVWSDTETGTAQGSVISPLLANIYLHYVFDLWVDVWRKKHARGEVIVIRYADDIILGFQWETDADRFRQSLGERLGKFGLELHPDKTRRIEFGRYAEPNRKRRGEGKPETFDFLGFTHISGKNGNGSYAVRRMTIRQRMRKKLQEIKQQLRKRMHDPVPQTGAWLRSVVQGYFNYYAVPGNLDSLGLFRERVLRYWGQALKRRSQIRRYAWVRRLKLAAQWLPTPRVLHPWPLDRFAATHPR